MACQEFKLYSPPVGTILLLTLELALLSACVSTSQNPAEPWIKSSQPLTLLSANDGATHLRIRAQQFDRDTNAVTQDSITVIRTGPDHPPIVKTVYGTVPNSIGGAPYIALTGDGRYGFIPSQGTEGATSLLGVSEPANLLSVIDLSTSQPEVIQTLDVPVSKL